MINEQWQTVNGYDKYQISNMGRVYSSYTGKYLHPTIDSDGYLVVGLYNNGIQKKKKVHLLVAEAFLDNPQHYNQVNHKDENKNNNVVSNLEWCSSQYNINYGTRNNKVATSLKNNDNKYRRKIARLTLDGMLSKIYDSLRSVEEDGFNHGAVWQLCNHKGRLKTYKGYLWEYVE